MPSSPTQTQLDAIAEYADGIPSEVVSSVMQAADQAGLTVVAKSGGTPAVVADSTTMERISVTGMPGTFLEGIAVGSKGWMVRVSEAGKTGDLTKSNYVFVPAGGDANLLD